jgi:exodeoxyribonuclease V alpha subunit
MQRETLEGIVERITYYSDESGYTVLRLRPDKPRFGQLRHNDNLLTVVGTLPELQPGESVRLTGTWTTHKDHGKQFRAESVEQMPPSTLEGLRRYLGSGLIKGIGPVSAGRIVDHFGLKTMDVLEEMPNRLVEVPGIGRHRVELIMTAWAEQRKIKDVMLFLQTHHVSTALAVKIYKTYGDQSIDQVLDDPYRLARDVRGIGFKIADQIARNLGLPVDSPARIAAGMLYALETMTDEGHVFGPRATTIEKAAELLDVPAERCEAAIEQLQRTDSLIIDTLPVQPNNSPSLLPSPAREGLGVRARSENEVPPETIEALYLPPMFYSEKGVTRRISNMVGAASSRLLNARNFNWESFFARLGSEDNTRLTDQQQAAVRAALTNKVSVLTGGPGTGKTTTLRTVIQALEAIDAKYALASPTGRAAKRLSEATERKASTIHRLLGYKPGEGFAYNEDCPLNVDMLVVDEASMIDLSLFYSVLKALAPETHLMLVGDVDQLPSVGAGDVLRDVIRSGKVYVTRLDTIFRQAETSLIIANAHRVNRGEMPDLSNRGTDFYLFTADDPDETADLVVDVVQNRIPNKFGLHPIDDIQVLAPMYRGSVGVQALNERLQAALNPPGRLAERRLAGRMFRVGDKVMQTRNNYDKEVFNGDIGRIQSIDFTEQMLSVGIDGRFVEYDWSDTDELIHAFAASVHRSQGTEYPAVVVPVVTQHYMMLQRNLLYTAITRARQLVVLVGTRKAVAMAVRNDKVAQRYSGLAWRLSQML